MVLESVQVGLPRTYGSGARACTTGYGKYPVRGPVRAGRTNLEGDGQADPRWHGGPDMAVLAYPAAHYAAWREELCWPSIPPGAFGENLTVSGTTEDEACLGDVWRVGSATLQISEPRKPCRNISRFWKRSDLLRRVVRSGRSGFYLRVVAEGTLQVGDEVALLERPYPEWTVARAARARNQAKRRPREAEALLQVVTLGSDWRTHVRNKLDEPERERPGAGGPA
jgi:MOSC domain-containing protein YiiM